MSAKRKSKALVLKNSLAGSTAPEMDISLVAHFYLVFFRVVVLHTYHSLARRGVQDDPSLAPHLYENAFLFLRACYIYSFEITFMIPEDSGNLYR